jgi:hypothetical protein
MPFDSTFFHITSFYFFLGGGGDFKLWCQKNPMSRVQPPPPPPRGEIGPKLQYFEEKKFEVSIFKN